MTKYSENSLLGTQPDSAFDGINQLNGILGGLDDRGLVLSLAAFAEEALGMLLKSYLITSNATTSLLEGFNAPLGTFSSRLKSAYAIGLITAKQFHDLECLRKIRNEFAHSWMPVELSKPKIAALIDGMNISRLTSTFPETPSQKLRTSLSCVLIELRSATYQIKQGGQKARLVGAELLRGFSGDDFNHQYQEASDELTMIARNLEGANGARLKFYLELGSQCQERLRFIRGSVTPEQEKKVETLRNTLSRIMKKA